MTQGRADLRGLSAPSRAWIASFTGIDLGRVEGTMAALLACTGRLSEAAELGEAAIAEQPPPILRAGQGGSPYVDGFLGVGLAHALLGEWQAAQGTFQHARALYQTMEHHHMVANACLHELELVQLPYIATDLDGRSRLAAAGEEAAKLSSAVVPRSVPTRWAALPTLVIEGIWNEAREVAAAAYGERRWTFRLFCAHWLAFLAYQQGDVGEAQRVIAAVLPDGPQTEPGNTFIWPALALQRLAAEMALDANDLPACRAWLESHDRWLQWSGAVFGRAKGDLLWARYHHAGDDQAAARRHAESALAQAAEPRQPLALIAVQRFLGQLDRLDQRFGEAEEHLRESLALADTCHAPFERALSLLALAPLRMTQREPEEARRLLDEARSICEPLGAKPTLERVAALEERLAATGSPESPA